MPLRVVCPKNRGLCQLGEMLMARAKLKTLREMSNDDLSGKLTDLRTDLSKIRSEGAKGTLKKQTGSVKYVRRDVARILTILNERKINL
jgi:large subunit ribosomal protein L29